MFRHAMRKGLLFAALLLPMHAVTAEPMDYEWLRSVDRDVLDCPFRGQIDFEHGEIECGLIEVPENREVPASRSIELHYVRIAAKPENEDDVREDPVIYLTGGPGVQVAGYVSRLRDHSILKRRDLYILEQRGIGSSGDFCPFFNDRNPAVRTRDSFEGAARGFQESARACFEKAAARGVDIRGYNTIENARDVRALRMALGYERWNVWGISYGSVLGQALIKEDPAGIRAMVLDAIVPLDLHELMRISHWFARDLEKLHEACADQRRCARAHADLEERYLAAIDRLREQPMEVSVPESVRFPDGKAWFFQDLVAGMPFSLLYEQSNHPALPAIMARLSRAVEERDEDFFRAMAVADTSGGFRSSMGMGLAVRCLDGYIDEQARLFPGDLERYPTLTSAFGHPDVVADGPALCREVGLTPRPREQYEQPRTDLPIVVANGAWDPITPPPLARYIMDGLANGRYVEFPHAGHGPTRSVDCAGDFMNDFFDDPTAALDEECVESGEEAARFLERIYETRAPLKGVLLMETRPEAVPMQAAWAGGSILLSGAGLLVMGIAFIGGRINRQPLPDRRGGSRRLVFLSTVLILAWLIGMALAAWRTGELSEALFLAGFLPWAGWVAWLAPLALLTAIAAAVQVARHYVRFHLAQLIGLGLVLLGVVSLSLFGLAWDLWPL
ncbi:alpha/beta fold hydrolase [Natronospira bacteriovora]|uniref:Alpha/beta fold hydrolase n=1 Tax=Natronospira bacteriovora TaxID=3069753 RepID=A0ABU0W7V3_9GAMM|nr:alpha/beta fold hydrolase [Natronospira sp. AB-CW4]MDQ2070071.1 alpha/beta fold hydrolase [Natronospira sp. AB-CW4]